MCSSFLFIQRIPKFTGTCRGPRGGLIFVVEQFVLWTNLSGTLRPTNMAITLTTLSTPAILTSKTTLTLNPDSICVNIFCYDCGSKKIVGVKKIFTYVVMSQQLGYFLSFQQYSSIFLRFFLYSSAENTHQNQLLTAILYFVNFLHYPSYARWHKIRLSANQVIQFRLRLRITRNEMIQIYKKRNEMI